MKTLLSKNLVFLLVFFMALAQSMPATADVPEPRHHTRWLQPYKEPRNVEVRVALLRKYSHYHYGRHYKYQNCIAIHLPGPCSYEYTVYEKNSKKIVEKYAGFYDEFGEKIWLVFINIPEVHEDNYSGMPSGDIHISKQNTAIPSEQNTVHAVYRIEGRAQYYTFKKTLKEKIEKDSSFGKISQGNIISALTYYTVNTVGDEKFIYNLIDKNGPTVTFAHDITVLRAGKKFTVRLDDAKDSPNEEIIRENDERILNDIAKR